MYVIRITDHARINHSRDGMHLTGKFCDASGDVLATTDREKAKVFKTYDEAVFFLAAARRSRKGSYEKLVLREIMED